MTKEIRSSNDESTARAVARGLLRAVSPFVIRHSFVIWISSFVILAPGDAAADQPVDYLREVKPILTQRCFACHGAIKQNARMRLDTVASMLRGGKSGAVVVPGKPDDSLLVGAITGDAAFRMPPENEGTRLTADEIAKVKRWIAEGAKHPDDEQPAVDPKEYWSYLPVKRPAVPDVTRPLTPAVSPATGAREWIRTPIDAFIAAEHDKHGLAASPSAEPATLLRRVYIDLIGLPPRRDELRAFLADPSDAAYEKVVDKLLASPQYGER